jgi:hypothetical protein
MRVGLFGLGQQGKSPVVTAQKHLNLYAEIIPAGEEETRVAFYGTPGLELFTSTLGDTPIRGWIAVGDYIYLVHRGTFWQIDNAGTNTSRGTIGTTSGAVYLAYNGVQIAIVDGGGARFYVYTIATLAFDTVTANLIGTPIDITYQDSYGILGFAGGQFQLTDLSDFKTLDALDFATAESNPDGLVRVIADHGEVILFGSNTVEFWGNSGGQDFPYTNQRGSSLEFGLAAPRSLVKYNDSLAGLFKNEMGQVQVMMMAGHAIKPISTPEIDYLINSYSAVADATFYSYMLAGHPMLQANFPSAGKSWLYDHLTGLWSPLESGLDGMRHRGEMRVDYLNKPRIADYENGNIYTISADAYTDNGTAIKRQIVGRHISKQGRMSVSRLELNMETGSGLASGQGSDPQAMLRVSKDGHTWGNELWRSIGRIGEYCARVFWNRLGSSMKGFWFEITITDPVKVVFTDAFLDAE